MTQRGEEEEEEQGQHQLGEFWGNFYNPLLSSQRGGGTIWAAKFWFFPRIHTKNQEFTSLPAALAEGTAWRRLLSGDFGGFLGILGWNPCLGALWDLWAGECWISWNNLKGSVLPKTAIGIPRLWEWLRNSQSLGKAQEFPSSGMAQESHENSRLQILNLACSTPSTSHWRTLGWDVAAGVCF